MRPNTSLALGLGAFLVIAGVLTATAGSVILIQTLVLGGMWSLIAVGLVMVFGVMNIPNFAQGEFFMIGTLAAYLSLTALQDAFPHSSISWAWPIIAIMAGAIAGGAVGMLVDRAIFATLRRRTRDAWAMDTFVITIGISAILINAHQLLFGTNFKGIAGYWNVAPVGILGTSVAFDRLIAFLIAIGVIALLQIALKYTRLGRIMRAVSQDEIGARLMGISVEPIYTITFGVGCGLAALAGGALLVQFPSSPYVGVQPLYIAFTVIILSGLGNTAGVIVGGFLVALFVNSTTYYLGDQWSNVVPFVLIIAILVIRPTGLFGRPVAGIWEE